LAISVGGIDLIVEMFVFVILWILFFTEWFIVRGAQRLKEIEAKKLSITLELLLIQKVKVIRITQQRCCKNCDAAYEMQPCWCYPKLPQMWLERQKVAH